MSNFNPVNVGLLLLGILLIMSAILDKSIPDLIRSLGEGNLNAFKIGDATAGSSGGSGFNGGGGFGGGGGGSF